MGGELLRGHLTFAKGEEAAAFFPLTSAVPGQLLEAAWGQSQEAGNCAAASSPFGEPFLPLLSPLWVHSAFSITIVTLTTLGPCFGMRTDIWHLTLRILLSQYCYPILLLTKQPRAQGHRDGT